MAKSERTTEFKGWKGWVDYRLPIFTFMKHQQEYRTPKNLSYMWSFGSLAGIALVLQIVSGIVLAMHYTPHVDHAFNSVERIMRDVPYGWLIRYMHAVGASLFFFVVYVHMFRGLYYGSFKKPRELLWWFGLIIFITMMATAFMGYVLPWGQMSFWGATVITNLFSAIPGIGKSIVTWLWGGFSVANPTLNRFFSLHYLLPFVIVGLVGLHLVALHIHGSNNPTGVEPKSDKETIPFHPYYTIKDFVGFGFFFLVLAYFVFYDPNRLGHPDNYTPANPMVTPPHIVPEWYFLPFYAMLRAVPSKLGGVMVMFGSLLILFVLPWLDTHKVKSGTYRPKFKLFFWVFVVDCILLGYLGGKPPEGVYVISARFATLYYFFFFLIALPYLSKNEKAKGVPESITASLKKAAVVLALGAMTVAGSAQANSGEGQEIKHVDWHFNGVFGTVDRQSAQRGYQVYKEVCSACHSMHLVHFRNLEDIGFPEGEAKALAAEATVQDGPNDVGDMFDRPGRLSDTFPSPYPNEKAARAGNGGALPPDLSLITKARFDGPNYVYSVLTGYKDAPKGFHLGENMHYNAAFPGNQIAMPAPLTDGRVTFGDGTPATVDQMAHDVVNFLQWAAEPEMEHRKEMGLKVFLYLLVFTGLFILAKKKVWSDVE